MNNELTKLALECADENFRSVVECGCKFYDIENNIFDLTNVDPMMIEDVDKALKYFSLRGNKLPYDVVTTPVTIKFVDKIKDEPKVYRVFPDYGAVGVWNQTNHPPTEEYQISEDILLSLGITKGTLLDLEHMATTYAKSYMGEPTPKFVKDYLVHLGIKITRALNRDVDIAGNNVKFVWVGVD